MKTAKYWLSKLRGRRRIIDSDITAIQRDALDMAISLIGDAMNSYQDDRSKAVLLVTQRELSMAANIFLGPAQ